MSAINGQKHIPVQNASVSGVWVVLAAMILIIAVIVPASGTNTTATPAVTSAATAVATTIPTVSPTHTATPTQTVTTAVTTAKTTATTAVPTSLPTTAVTTLPAQNATTTTVQTTTTTAVPTSAQTTAATTVPTQTATATATSISQIAETAGFSGSPPSGPAPLIVQFTDLSSGAPTSWNWNFGDGETDTTQNPSHTYSLPGSYTVTLTVTIGGTSYTSSQAGYVSVDETTATPAPTDTSAATEAAFSGSPTTGTEPLTVMFTDSSTGSPTSWNWNFGDGETDTTQNPSHTYAIPGSYTVSLTTTGPEGTSIKSLSDYITVEGSTTPVPTQPPEQVTSNDNTETIPTLAVYPVISRSPTPVETPVEQNDNSGTLVFVVIIVAIAAIAVAAVIIYIRHKGPDMLG